MEQMEKAKKLYGELKMLADEMEMPVEKLISKCSEEPEEDMEEKEEMGPDKGKVALIVARMRRREGQEE